ncbi:MAG: hypothetical protein JWN89_23 [Parcubacteria group bacterium]|nr:hypothetical protein [Parcubacteria group bacterium]
MNRLSAVRLEKISSFASRQRLYNAVVPLLLVGALGLIGLLPMGIHLSTGIFFLALAFLMKLFLLDLFFVSLALERGDQTYLAVLGESAPDPLSAILKHPAGKVLSARLGVTGDEMKTYLASRTAPSRALAAKAADLEALVRSVYAMEDGLRTFLSQKGVTENALALAASMAEQEYTRLLQKKILLKGGFARHNIGSSLAFGEAYFLERFSLSFRALGAEFEASEHAEEVDNLISVLSRSREANAVLVGDDKLSVFSILYSLEHATGREMNIFDGSRFASEYGDKASFESNLSKLFDEILHAGNILLVIPDFPEFIKSARAIGCDVVTLLDTYLASAHLQLVTTASRRAFEETFEHEPGLLARFEKVMVREESDRSIQNFIISRVKDLEEKGEVYFTAGAILAVRDSVLRFSSDLLVDSADDLLEEAVARAHSNVKRVISAEDILARVESKTGVPLSGVSEAEKQKLSKLEELLGARVVGQPEAVGAVSSALRRARAGISSEKRPMGSFLFLGPTGVGKTETTKALSDIFFGSDSPLVRFDMSEYNSENALTRMIGTLDSAGTLPSALREHEYGVLLLDEFEKTDKAVLDLFLQILDEGFFSDGQGKRVSVRNHIIICTSNAASDLIFNIIESGRDLAPEKDSIISTLIDRGTFKPELLNRFDGIVLFHPLSKESLEKISRIMLEALGRRLEGKGLRLDINDELVNFLVNKGQDPKFGARPLNRAIQDSIEAVVAKRMLEGALKPGDRITLTSADLV